MPEQTWALIVHGGASAIPGGERDAYRFGVQAAVDAGRAVLADGGRAVDAAVAAVRVLESDPVFNAGLGAAADADGTVQRDAAVMDGRTLDVGAVGAVRDVPHPVELAATMLGQEEILIVDRGATRLAEQRGFFDAQTPSTRSTHRHTHDTVGCVALDAQGHLATAVSTGGLDGAPPGRIGDSPMPGSGFFADDQAGAVVLSGHGERIARVALAAWVMHDLEEGRSPDDAAARALQRLARVGGDAGLLVMTPRGDIAWTHNSPDFAVGWARSDGFKGCVTGEDERHG